MTVRAAESPGDAAGPAPAQAWFGVDDLRELRALVADWAARAGLAAQRAEDFVLAVNEIATNAVQHGSPAAVLELSAVGRDSVQAEIRDTGPGMPAARPVGDLGGWGLGVARQVCDEVTVTTGGAGTSVVLRMNRTG